MDEEIFSSPSSSPSSSSSSHLTFASSSSSQLPLLSLNHVSFVCESVCRSVRFYEEVLGFVLIKRPSSFKFEGAWLFNHGISIHLLEVAAAPGNIKGKRKINPRDNHISFQCSNTDVVVQKLEEMNIEFETRVLKEGGITVDQLFFHDPDGYMIEICNCQNLPVLPLAPCPLKKIPRSASASRMKTPSFFGDDAAPTMPYWCGEVEALMMENLAVDMMKISF